MLSFFKAETLGDFFTICPSLGGRVTHKLTGPDTTAIKNAIFFR